MPPEIPFADLANRLRDGDPDAARLVFERFAQRLVCLAATRLPRVLSAKVDAEDVAQSVLKSFFARQSNGHFTLESWDSLWSLLTVLTVRKCGHRVKHFRAACRDVRREAPCSPAPSTACEIAAPDPTPAEALLLADTLEEVLQGLLPAHRPIVQFRLEGCTIEEVSRKAGCTERSVYRVLEKVRARLDEMLEDDSR